MSKQKVYQAAWPHVLVKIIDEASGQPTVIAFAEGGTIPPSADPEDVKRLVVKGALVEVEAAEADKPAKETALRPVTSAPVAPAAAKPADKPVAPQPNATRAEWIAYAVANRAAGVSESDAKAEAEAMPNKADLIAKYGKGNGS